MSKKTQKEIPADMWLHVATDALARWATAEEGEMIIDYFDVSPRGDIDGPAIVLYLPLPSDDPRFAPMFAKMVDRAVAENKEMLGL